MNVIVVGAGLAGLTCARHLDKQNINVQVFEASDGVGGRVRSDQMDGFVLDRGFQVLFDAYPAVRRNVDLDALDLHAFEPGAIICRDGQRTVLTDPLRDRTWRDVLEATRSSAIPFGDKLRTLRLALKLRDRDSDQSSEPDNQSTEAYLRDEGFSEQTIDTFFRPFYGGIFLDRSLATTAAAFRFYFRMLSAGQTALPARGIGALAQQLAAPLQAAGNIQTNAPVVELLRDGPRVAGVILDNGDAVRADAVVLATDAPTARKFIGATISAPEGALHTAAVYFAGSQPLTHSRKLILNAAPEAFVNNAQVLSNVAPSYAPVGRHLLSATVIGERNLSDSQMVINAMRDLRRMFEGNPRALQALDTHYPLRVYRIRYAQFPQPPGVYRTLPGNKTDHPNLFVAGEWTESSSINGAMTSGERCAGLVGQHVRELARMV